MKYKNIILLFSILIFSLTCDETTLPKDCLGDEGGTAYLDECGVCDADSNNDNLFPPTIEKTDSTELIIGCMDCTGEVGGTYWYDECNVCDIYSSYNNNATWDNGEPFDDANANGIWDDAEEFEDINSNGVWDDTEDYTEIGEKPTTYPYGDCDCAGVLHGDAMVDDCGECVGGLTTNAVYGCGTDPCIANWAFDTCNICYGDNSPNTGDCDCAASPIGDAVEDCTGVCNGSAELDECGECEGDNSTCDVGCGPNQPSPSGCDNACGSILVEDNCDICGGDNSTCSDCAGEFGGAAYLNECGTCICNGSESLDGYECVVSDECIQDCNNDWGGDNYECIQDCNGDWDGSASIDCSGECRGGNTAYCIENDSLSETDCDDLENTWDENLAYTICACFDTTADNFYCHKLPLECRAFNLCNENPNDNVCNDFDFENQNINDVCCENNTSVDDSCYSDCILSDDILASQFSNPYIDSEECEYSPNPLIINQGCVNGYENPQYGLVYHDSSLCEVYGCTNSLASNYNPDATLDNQVSTTECQYLGCTDENAINFDFYADIDNGSCNNYLILSWNEDDNTKIDVNYYSTTGIGGFQFDLINAIFTSESAASDGEAATNGFLISTSNQGTTALGFSMMGQSIPSVPYEDIEFPEPSILTTINIAIINSDSPICIQNLVFSDSNQEFISFESSCIE